MEKIPSIAVCGVRSNERGERNPLSPARVYNLCCKIRKKTNNSELYYELMKVNSKSKGGGEIFRKNALKGLVEYGMSVKEASRFIEIHLD